jgi:hypothetical protein
MTQTLYAQMNKRKKKFLNYKKRSLLLTLFRHSEFQDFFDPLGFYVPNENQHLIFAPGGNQLKINAFCTYFLDNTSARQYLYSFHFLSLSFEKSLTLYGM